MTEKAGLDDFPDFKPAAHTSPDGEVTCIYHTCTMRAAGDVVQALYTAHVQVFEPTPGHRARASCMHGSPSAPVPLSL
jgi:hypothetical protein